MTFGRTLGFALAGVGLLAAPSVARADEEALQGRLQELEEQVRELKNAVHRKETAGEKPLSDQVDRYLQEDEKRSLWVDKHGKPLSKVLDSIFVTARLRARPEWSNNYYDTVFDPLDPANPNDPGFPDYDTPPDTEQTSELTGKERRTIRAPKTSVDDEGVQTFFRGCLGMGANLKEGISLFVEFSFAGTWGNVSEPYSANDDPSLVQFTSGYVDGVYSKHLRLDTRIGRFYLDYGDEYVLGNTEFAQGSMYYDGIRISRNFESSGFMVDFFAVKLVDGFKRTVSHYDSTVPAFFTGNTSPNDSIYMAGIYGNYYGLEGKTKVKGGLEPYYIFIWNGAENTGVADGDTYDIHTGGAHWYGGKDTRGKTGIEWDINGNAQYHRAAMRWSGDARITYNLATLPLKPRVFGQAAYASGDRDDNPADGNESSHAYNPLFGDGHGRFGWADYFAFTNLMVYGAGLHFAPQENWDIGFEGRAFYLARETEVTVTTPTTSVTVANDKRRLAFEGDFVLTHRYSDNVSMEAVCSYISWRDVPGDNVQRAYVQVVVEF